MVVRSGEGTHLTRRQLDYLAVAADIKREPQTRVLGDNFVDGLSQCQFGTLFHRQTQYAVRLSFHFSP